VDVAFAGKSLPPGCPVCDVWLAKVVHLKQK
jgi:hypothetical protein